MTYRQRNQILRRRRAAHRQQRHRRGVLLLVVLSMLVLFMMIGTAFLMTSDMYRKGSKAAAKEGRVGNPPRELLDRALYQLLRDTNNQFSVVRYHSLLRDMYGTDGFEATAALARFATGPNLGSNPTQGQFIDILIHLQSDVLKLHRTIDNLPIPHFLPLIDGYYNGTLLTFTSGSARGQSFRVLQYEPNARNQQYWLRLMAVPHANMTVVNPQGQLAGHSFIVNGRPYNGTGVGYNPTVAAGLPRLSSMAAILPSIDGNSSFYAEVALTPNSVSFATLPANVESLLTNPDNELVDYGHYPGPGDCDESYDAPDFQNIFLAHETVMPTAQGTWRDINGQPQFYLENVPIPSFHRMALFNYWRKKVLDWGLNPEGDLAIALKRKIMMRPLREDHPNFDGSNPQSRPENTEYWEIVGPWDVDNDNDGVPDSVFVDLGDPVQQAEDGTLYKPLYAIKIIDLDSRLNVNAHGTAEHVAPGQFGIGLASGIVSNDQMPHGIGYGTPEISLRPVFPAPYNALPGNRVEYSLNNGSRDPTIEIDDYAALLWGRISVTRLTIGGRYGSLDPSLSDSLDPLLSNIQATPGINYGPNSVMPDPMAGYKFFDHPLSIFDLKSFGSPPDLKGRYAGGLDHFGQPVSEAHNDSYNPYLLANSPYELNLGITSRRGIWDLPQDGSFAATTALATASTLVSDDAPFATAELERILRAYDADAGTIPSRLWELVDAFDPHKLSFDPRVLNISIPTPNPTAITTADLPALRKTASQQQAAINRRLVTTDSYDLPVPSGNMGRRLVLGADGILGTPDDYKNLMNQPVPLGAGILDLLHTRMQYERTKRGKPLLLPAELNVLSQNLLAPEVLAGHRMDLNRPFGNGLDGNSLDDNYNGVIDDADEKDVNGVVDEPGEGFSGIGNRKDDNGDEVVDEPGEVGDQLWNPNDPKRSLTLTALAQTGGVPFDYTNGIDVNGDSNNRDYDNDNDTDKVDFQIAKKLDAQLARQLYARHLYVLMMLLMDENYQVERDLSCANDQFLFNKIKRNGLSEEQLARKLTARRIAQWAINCADFRDADAIMTPFEYDENPFDGWGIGLTGMPIDGTLETDENLGIPAEDQTRAVVWGAERPELLITETFAYHDRRCTDERDLNTGTDELNHEMLEDGNQNDEIDPDDDLDQRYKPRGTLFVELYNPWTDGAQAPAEFYPNRNDFAQDQEDAYQRMKGVALDRLSNKRTGDNIGSPVWRMVVARDTCSGRLSNPVDRTPSGDGNLEKLDPTRRMLDFDGFGVDPDKAGERYVYFVPENKKGLIPGDKPQRPGTVPPPRQYFVTNQLQQPALAPVKPGRYAVIGPSGIPMDGTKAVQGAARHFVSPLSRLVPTASGDNEQTDQHHISHMKETRRIELRPNSDPEVQQLLVADNYGSEFIDVSDGNYQNATGTQPGLNPCVAIPIEDLNISEPVEGYPSNRYRDLYEELGFGKFPPLGEPQKNQYGEVKYEKVYDTPFDMEFDLVRNGTTANYRTIHLQRLANPLLPWNPPPFDKDGKPNPEHKNRLKILLDGRVAETTDPGQVIINPYLTVDSMSVDLTAFNGMNRAAEDFPNQNLTSDPDNEKAMAKFESIPKGAVLQGDYFAPLSADELVSAPDHVIEELIKIFGEDPLPKVDVYRQSIQSNPTTFKGKLERLEVRRNGDNRSKLLDKDNDGQWGWHRIQRPLPDKEITFGGRQGDFQQRMHLKSLERGSHHRQVYKTAADKAGWGYDPAWEPRLLWKQEPPNRTIVLGRKKFSDLVNVLDRDLLRGRESGDELTPEERTKNKQIISKIGSSPHVFDFVMQHTLGFINESFAPKVEVNSAGVLREAQALHTTTVLQGLHPAVAPWVALNTTVLSPNDHLPLDEQIKMLRRRFRPEAADVTRFLNPQNPEESEEKEPIVPKNEGQRLEKMLGSTFPAFPWNNRPFVSQMELLQVPASSSSMLLRDYSVMNDDSPNPYNPVPEASQNNDPKQKLARQRAPYGHLLNFLQTSVYPSTPSSVAPNYHRLLEFVHVPTRFVNSETLLDPREFSGMGSGGPLSQIVVPLGQFADDPRVNFQPPYNKVSNYREPGRVNLNTVSSQRISGEQQIPGKLPYQPKIWSEVYDGIMHRLQDGEQSTGQGPGSHFGPAWRDVVLSRRGYALVSDRNEFGGQADVLSNGLNSDFPTFFANPFRASDAGDLVPLQNMVQPGVNAGLLRAHPYNQGEDRTWGNPNVWLGRSWSTGVPPGTGKNTDRDKDKIASRYLIDNDGEPKFDENGNQRVDPLLPIPQIVGNSSDPNFYSSSIPLFSESIKVPHVDAQRNPHFFYQPLTRLGNLTTTRSGVFAVWITVAYFEVEPAPSWNETTTKFGGDGNGQKADVIARALYDHVYPEGYQLGQEVGIETGDTRRHRGFYIVDRTLPVGFKPGENLNVENMIRLRRRIE
jgi:hypothetical protein